MHSRKDIYTILDEERAYQDAKYGAEHEKDHTIWDFVQSMLVHLMSARNHAQKNNFISDMVAFDELRKTTALGIAAMERLGYTRRYQNKPLPPTIKSVAIPAIHH